MTYKIPSAPANNRTVRYLDHRISIQCRIVPYLNWTQLSRLICAGWWFVWNRYSTIRSSAGVSEISFIVRRPLFPEFCELTLQVLFPTRLLTSEDEYKWYWHQMIYFPETINTVSILNTISSIRFHLSFPNCAHYSLCACWHPEAVEESSSLTSCCLLILSRLVRSFSFPCLGSTDAPYSRHGGPVPLFPRWHPHSQGPRTLPHRDPEKFNGTIVKRWNRLSTSLAVVFLKWKKNIGNNIIYQYRSFKPGFDPC
jgi:hypothetical protein